jgi:uncharacterized protein YdeI (YjbR/CyaY-like superfamily)
MKTTKSVLAYIETHPNRKEELMLLRKILNDCDLNETIKWGAPCYTVDGKNIVGLAAFKSHIALWFHQGVFLKDPENVLINAQKGVTKALRQWRFQSIDDISPVLIKSYIKEAIINHKAGKEMKPEPKIVQMPVELTTALASDIRLKANFEKLTLGKQKEYSEHIGTAKQDKTRISRLEKAIPLINAGTGLHDKYKK